MRRECRAILIGALFALFVFASSPAAPGQDFNEARLQAGNADYREKRYPEAIDEFRIAAFGFIDQPVRLSESLVGLTLAQAAAGKAIDADATVARFLDVERRFGVFGKTSLDPGMRSEFEALLTRRVQEATLLSIPTLARMVETEEQKIAKLPPEQRARALEAAARREPTNVRWPLALARNSMAQGDAKEAARWAGKALALDGRNSDALALRAQARTARGECTDAMKDLTALSEAEFQSRPDLYADKFVCAVEGKDWISAEQVVKLIPSGLTARRDVAKAQQALAVEQKRRVASLSSGSGAKPRAASGRPTATPPPSTVPLGSKDVLEESRRLVRAGKANEAEGVLAEAIKTDPGNRDLRLAFLEAACLSRAYVQGAAQVAVVTPFGEDEASSMFYAAVVLYETGKKDEARGYLNRAMPKVSGPLVDEYAKKILGQP